VKFAWDVVGICGKWARGALALIAILAVLLWVQARRQISEQKATGMGAVALAPFFESYGSDPRSEDAEGMAGGVPGGLARASFGDVQASPMPAMDARPAPDRRIVRQGGIRAVVSDLRRATDSIAARTQELGGYVSSLKRSATATGYKTEMRIRVPAARFEEMRRHVLDLALEVKLDQVIADDVTKRYTDLERNIRNYRAEEEQYLQIMKRAAKITDVLEVTEKLADVRGRIEDAEASLRSLSHDIDMSALSIELEPEEAAPVAGISWKPAAAVKAAYYDAADSLGDFAGTLVGLIFHLPIIILWAVLTIALLVLGWKVLRLLLRLLAPGVLNWRKRDVPA